MRACGSPCGGSYSENLTRRESCRGARRSTTGRSRQRHKGPPTSTKTKCGEGAKLMVVADSRGLPLGVRIALESPAEVTLVESTLEQGAGPTATPCGCVSKSKGRSSSVLIGRIAKDPQYSTAVRYAATAADGPSKGCGVAQKLPPTCCSIRALVQDILGLPESRLPDDHPSTVLNMLLVLPFPLIRTCHRNPHLPSAPSAFPSWPSPRRCSTPRAIWVAGEVKGYCVVTPPHWAACHCIEAFAFSTAFMKSASLYFFFIFSISAIISSPLMDASIWFIRLPLAMCAND